MHTARNLAFASTALALAALAPVPARAQAPFAHAQQAGALTFGYLPGARPVTWRNDAGDPEVHPAFALARLQLFHGLRSGHDREIPLLQRRQLRRSAPDRLPSRFPALEQVAQRGRYIASHQQTRATRHDRE
jgi:hypothetical protein